MAKKITPLSANEQLILRNKAKEELTRLNAIKQNENTIKLIEDFKTTFSFCEILYKIILDDHQYNKTGKHPERMLVTMTQVPFVLDYAGYDFDKEMLKKLFGSEEKVGVRSVKKLRDSLTHSLNQRAIDELFNRKDELYGYMNEFLEKIDRYDVAT